MHRLSQHCAQPMLCAEASTDMSAPAQTGNLNLLLHRRCVWCEGLPDGPGAADHNVDVQIGADLGHRRRWRRRLLLSSPPPFSHARRSWHFECAGACDGAWEWEWEWEWEWGGEVVGAVWEDLGLEVLVVGLVQVACHRCRQPSVLRQRTRLPRGVRRHSTARAHRCAGSAATAPRWSARWPAERTSCCMSYSRTPLGGDRGSWRVGREPGCCSRSWTLNLCARRSPRTATMPPQTSVSRGHASVMRLGVRRP
eukprot:3802067-Rhodomonas_salina.8